MEMSVNTMFDKKSRPDDLPRAWDFSIQKGYENVPELIEIGEELYEIPVDPLPDPLVASTEPWHVTMNISGYEFENTWEQYLDVLSDCGTIRVSEFEYIRLPEDEQPAPPRPQCAARIVVELPKKVGGRQLYFTAMIFATGRVKCLAMDEERYDELFG